MIFALILFLFPLAFSPGPGNIFFAANGARYGLRDTLWANGGYHLATFVVTLALGFGFGAATEQMPLIFEGIRWLGAGYVLFLASKFFTAGILDSEDEAKPAGFFDGIVLLVLNPKAYVIIALMFSQFLGHEGSAADIWLIATVFTLNNCVAFLAWTVLGDRIAGCFRNVATAKTMNVIFGLTLSAVAIWMLLR